MIDTLAFYIALSAVALLVGIACMLPGGCSGDCEQGRKPCNCDRGKWEK